ncbi:MAG: hypothetical protein HC853_01675 [Anaerolineae bacterium]|nr:hypothetical protein [Anaerolineae bacterium]
MRRYLCPTRTTEDIYMNQWLGGVLGYGTQLIEFMLHSHDQHFCYDKTHQHIEPKPKISAAYDNVIGYGPWYVARMKVLLARVHEAGQANNPSFSLTHEFLFHEVLLPYIDEFYARNSSAQAYASNQPAPGLTHANVFQFLFNELVTEKMDMIDSDLLTHPGYQEARKTSSPPIALPTEMLDGALDDSDALPGFEAWRDMAKCYCDTHFQLSNPGIAPRYDVNGVRYTYQRSLAAVMNLRSNLFRVGAAAVAGERMLLPAEWLAQSNDFYAELVNMTVRAARLHMQFAAYFRQGVLLGPVRIRSGNRTAQAWRIPLRDFSDMPPLVADVQASADPTLPSPPGGCPTASRAIPTALNTRRKFRWSKCNTRFGATPVTPCMCSPTWATAMRR